MQILNYGSGVALQPILGIFKTKLVHLTDDDFCLVWGSSPIGTPQKEEKIHQLDCWLAHLSGVSVYPFNTRVIKLVHVEKKHLLLEVTWSYEKST